MDPFLIGSVEVSKSLVGQVLRNISVIRESLSKFNFEISNNNKIKNNFEIFSRMKFFYDAVQKIRDEAKRGATSSKILMVFPRLSLWHP